MEKETVNITTIDEYINSRPEEIRPILTTIRQIIREAAPGAGEKISWGMATFTLYGNLVHFAAETRHLGFHPGPSAIDAFKSEFSNYKYSKGTVQFPYQKPLPADLIQRMVRFRVQEQTELEKTRREKKKTSAKIKSTADKGDRLYGQPYKKQPHHGTD